jgi:hypothetical protein
LSAAFEQGQRMITSPLYLNQDCDGGETTFPEPGIVNRGRRSEKMDRHAVRS